MASDKNPSTEPILPKWWRTVDKWSITSVLVLFAIGLLLGFAASPPLAGKNGLAPFYYVQRQMIFGGSAMIVMLITSMMSPRLVRRLAVLGFIASFIALALLPVLGTDFGKGAVRWYSLGFASIQPTEFLKPGFVVIIAWLMAANYEPGGPLGHRWAFGLTVLVAGITAFQPDFGQAALIITAWGIMYFVAGASIPLLLSTMAIGIIAGVFAYFNSQHFARRIDGFLSTDIDPTTQLGFATNAIREGGYFGVGVGEGSVKWSLPDAHTDFIIAVAAEEYGFVLVFCIIALYATVILRSLYRLYRERDLFIRIAGTGLLSIFGVQALINLGVAVRLLPAKGMTLPFVSYGGSSLIAGGIAIGMLLAFTRVRPQGQIGELLMRRGH